MTDSYLELQAYVDRLTVYLWIIGALFVISVIATVYVLFFAKGDEENG